MKDSQAYLLIVGALMAGFGQVALLGMALSSEWRAWPLLSFAGIVLGIFLVSQVQKEVEGK